MLKISFWRPMQQLRRSSPQRAGRRDEAGCFASGRSSTSIPRSRGRDFGYLTPDRRLRRLRRKTRRLILQTHTGLATLCGGSCHSSGPCSGLIARGRVSAAALNLVEVYANVVAAARKCRHRRRLLPRCLRHQGSSRGWLYPSYGRVQDSQRNVYDTSPLVMLSAIELELAADE